MASRVSKNLKARALKPKSKPRVPVSRPLKEASKPQVTVSTSNLLRRKPLREVYSKRSRRYGRGISDPEDDLLLDFQDQVATSRTELQSTSIAAINHSHVELVSSLENIHAGGVAFQDNLCAQRKQLLSPLVNETIETVYRRGRKSRTVVINIGQRVQDFNDMIADTQSKLKSCWADWEVVQQKIIELGADILGPKAFPGGVGKAQNELKGYRKEMEILDAEDKAFREGVEKELQLIGQDAMDKMKAAEKELNVSLKKQKADFFVRLLEEDD